ncbi:RING finger protein 145-like [Saccostrea cucullata]|uniref:RING finger protein 145-like n=1 Tax=Saccostrea cuccullata TaxID=36930 RepID=UPI002ED3927B
MELFQMKRSTEYILQSSAELNWIDVLAFCTADCTNNPLGLLITCITVSLVFNFMRFLVTFFLSTATSDNKFNWTEGLTLFLTCIKFGDGTTKFLDLQQRAVIIRSSLLYVTAIFLNSTYRILNPSMTSFSAIPTTKPFKQFRILSVYIVIAAFSLYMVSILFQSDIFLTMVPVIIMCVFTSLQAATSVATYTLCIFNTCRIHPLDNVDDTLFCIRTTIKMIDFLCSVFLGCTGVWVIITEGLSWIQTPLLIFHCSDNIWRQLQFEWKTFNLRKETARKMNSLVTANMAELHNDLCPICHQSMSSAIETPCRHMYHKKCLKKWLHIKNTCPLCNGPLTTLSKEETVTEIQTAWYFPFCIQILIGPSSITPS